MTLSMNNISNELESEIDDLRETIIKEVGVQLANLTDELNALKQKQNKLIELGDDHDDLLDILSTTAFEQYANYAESVRNESFQELTRRFKSRSTLDLRQFATYRLQDELLLKLYPIDDNLNKV